MNKFSLSEMMCINEGHETNQLIGLCIDPNCTNLNKLLCIECVFNIHSQHKLIKAKQIEDKVNEEINSSSLSKAKEDEFQTKLKSVEEKIANSIEMLKTDILEIFAIKFHSFLLNFQSTISDLTKSNMKFNEKLLLQTKNDYEALSEAISTYYGDIINQSSIKLSAPSKEKDLMEELVKFECNFDKYVKEEKQTICDFFTKKFMTILPSALFSNVLFFEWSETKYGNYGFVYQLTNNKLTATKTLSEGTITIVRAKDQLSFDENYYIEFSIDCKKGGDVDIGFGRDSVGISCWTRTSGAYGITNIGIFENGKLVKKDVKLQDGDIIGFELSLKSSKTCKLFLNTVFAYEFKIEIDEIYPMCAIRKIDNSVTVRRFKTIIS